MCYKIAIAAKIYIMGEKIRMEKTYTTYEVSKICGVTMKTVAGWIEADKMLAFKTVGGHRRIKEEDLVSFLKKNNIPFPAELRDKGLHRVLIVDDEKLVVNLISKLLDKEKNMFVYSVATDGFEAGRQTLSFNPDLIVLDLMLPGIDGFEVCRKIKGEPKLNHIKIIAITGFPSEENERKIREAGVDAYLPKPFDTVVFMKDIHKLLHIKNLQETK